MASATNPSPRTTTASSEVRSENSVMFALGELAKLESDRVAEESARKARVAEEARRAEEREAAARIDEVRRAEEREARTRAVAEAEARLRVEAELAQDARVVAMKAELARVQAERAEIQRAVVEGARPEAPSASRAWPLAFGLSSVVAAALAGLLVLQAQTEPRVVEVERQVVVTVPAAAPAPLAQAPVTATATEASPVEERVAAPTPVATHGRTPRRDRTPTTTTVRPHHDDGLDFGDDGDDVLGGLDREDTSMRGTHR